MNAETATQDGSQGVPPRAHAILGAVAGAARLFRAADLPTALDETLADLGQATGVSRAFLVEIGRDPARAGTSFLSHEWTAPGVPSLLRDPAFEAIAHPPATDWLQSALNAGRPFVIRAAQAGPLRDLLARIGSRTVLIVPVEVNGVRSATLGFEDAVEDRDWHEDEIAALAAAGAMIGAALEQAEATSRAVITSKLEGVGRLAGGLAHDFNNILMVIDGHARFLADTSSGEEARSDAEAIIAAVRRGTSLTRQLMAFSSKRVDTLEAVDLNALIARSRQTFERLVGPGISIEIATTPGLPEAVTDPTQFEHVLVNLVSNARDAMPDGGTLSIATGLGPDQRSVELVVRDTGLGIDEAIHSRIFEPLFTTKPSGRGTGFGLAIVQAVVTGSGGTVAVASRPGEGATFRIRLPIAGSDPAADPAATAADPVMDA